MDQFASAPIQPSIDQRDLADRLTWLRWFDRSSCNSGIDPVGTLALPDRRPLGSLKQRYWRNIVSRIRRPTAHRTIQTRCAVVLSPRWSSALASSPPSPSPPSPPPPASPSPSPSPSSSSLLPPSLAPLALVTNFLSAHSSPDTAVSPCPTTIDYRSWAAEVRQWYPSVAAWLALIPHTAAAAQCSEADEDMVKWQALHDQWSSMDDFASLPRDAPGSHNHSREDVQNMPDEIVHEARRRTLRLNVVHLCSLSQMFVNLADRPSPVQLPKTTPPLPIHQVPLVAQEQYLAHYSRVQQILWALLPWFRDTVAPPAGHETVAYLQWRHRLLASWTARLLDMIIGAIATLVGRPSHNVSAEFGFATLLRMLYTPSSDTSEPPRGTGRALEHDISRLPPSHLLRTLLVDKSFSALRGDPIATLDTTLPITFHSMCSVERRLLRHLPPDTFRMPLVDVFSILQLIQVSLLQAALLVETPAHAPGTTILALMERFGANADMMANALAHLTHEPANLWSARQMSIADEYACGYYPEDEGTERDHGAQPPNGGHNRAQLVDSGRSVRDDGREGDPLRHDCSVTVGTQNTANNCRQPIKYSHVIPLPTEQSTSYTQDSADPLTAEQLTARIPADGATQERALHTLAALSPAHFGNAFACATLYRTDRTPQWTDGTYGLHITLNYHLLHCLARWDWSAEALEYADHHYPSPHAPLITIHYNKHALSDAMDCSNSSNSSSNSSSSSSSDGARSLPVSLAPQWHASLALALQSTPPNAPDASIGSGWPPSDYYWSRWHRWACTAPKIELDAWNRERPGLSLWQRWQGKYSSVPILALTAWIGQMRADPTLARCEQSYCSHRTFLHCCTAWLDRAMDHHHLRSIPTPPNAAASPHHLTALTNTDESMEIVRPSLASIGEPTVAYACSTDGHLDDASLSEAIDPQNPPLSSHSLGHRNILLAGPTHPSELEQTIVDYLRVPQNTFSEQATCTIVVADANVHRIQILLDFLNASVEIDSDAIDAPLSEESAGERNNGKISFTAYLSYLSPDVAHQYASFAMADPYFKGCMAGSAPTDHVAMHLHAETLCTRPVHADASNMPRVLRHTNALVGRITIHLLVTHFNDDLPALSDSIPSVFDTVRIAVDSTTNVDTLQSYQQHIRGDPSAHVPVDPHRIFLSALRLRASAPRDKAIHPCNKRHTLALSTLQSPALLWSDSLSSYISIHATCRFMDHCGTIGGHARAMSASECIECDEKIYRNDHGFISADSSQTTNSLLSSCTIPQWDGDANDTALVTCLNHASATHRRLHGGGGGVGGGSSGGDNSITTTSAVTTAAIGGAPSVPMRCELDGNVRQWHLQALLSVIYCTWNHLDEQPSASELRTLSGSIECTLHARKSLEHLLHLFGACYLRGSVPVPQTHLPSAPNAYHFAWTRPKSTFEDSHAWLRHRMAAMYLFYLQYPNLSRFLSQYHPHWIE